MIEKLKKTISRWIKLWPDLWAAPLALIALWGSYYLLNWIDPTIGTFDMGMLQALLFTAVILVILNTLVFLGIEYNDKGLWKYYKSGSERNIDDDLNSITPWERLKLLYFWRALQFVLSVAIFQALI